MSDQPRAPIQWTATQTAHGTQYQMQDTTSPQGTPEEPTLCSGCGKPTLPSQNGTPWHYLCAVTAAEEARAELSDAREQLKAYGYPSPDFKVGTTIMMMGGKLERRELDIARLKHDAEHDASTIAALKSELEAERAKPSRDVLEESARKARGDYLEVLGWIKRAQEKMDLANVPSPNEYCEDPHCLSLLEHRVTLLIAERDREREAPTYLRWILDQIRPHVPSPGSSDLDLVAGVQGLRHNYDKAIEIIAERPAPPAAPSASYQSLRQLFTDQGHHLDQRNNELAQATRTIAEQGAEIDEQISEICRLQELCRGWDDRYRRIDGVLDEAGIEADPILQCDHGCESQMEHRVRLLVEQRNQHLQGYLAEHLDAHNAKHIAESLEWTLDEVTHLLLNAGAPPKLDIVEGSRLDSWVGRATHWLIQEREYLAASKSRLLSHYRDLTPPATIAEYNGKEHLLVFGCFVAREDLPRSPFVPWTHDEIMKAARQINAAWESLIQ